MLPGTEERVPKHTAPSVNEDIRESTCRRLREVHGGGAAAIDRRLREIDREWDIERTLEANAASLAFAGTVLGLTVSRKFLFIPALVTAFLLQHALQGWCPPVPIFRRLGYRTAAEQDEERYALKLMRGDLDPLLMKPGEGRDAGAVYDALHGA